MAKKKKKKKKGPVSPRSGSSKGGDAPKKQRDRGRPRPTVVLPASRPRRKPKEATIKPPHEPPTASAHEAPPAGQPAPEPETEPGEPELVVVAIGSSAGGLEVLSEILSKLEPDSGAAYVIIQHLSPEHRSAMVELLGPKCAIPVVEVRDGLPLEPNRVYMLPANTEMSVKEGCLHLGPRPEGKAGFTPINRFFRSLGEDPGIRPVGVILTGTSSDGAAGIRDIKAAGGITMAQDPASAKFDVMPRAAINTGLVDLVLTPADIANELNQIVKHPSIRAERAQRPAAEAKLSPEEFGEIFDILRKRTGVDFSQYKSPTIRRRLQRRLALHKVDGIKAYVELLRSNGDEASALHDDLLIQVTNFFREPQALEALREVVFPRLLADRLDDDATLRFWVPGCSTGEEAYSLAIEILDFLHSHSESIPVQIFATDVSELAVERARAGLYPETIADEVPPDRLRRYFGRTDGRFRVNKQIRDICVFARQDLTRDPPFSRLDLIVCRNVMIYLSQQMQKRLLTVFHYALRPNGYLLLGRAETAGPAQELFSGVEKNVRLFVKRPVETPSHAVRGAAHPPFSAPARPVADRERGHEPAGTLQAEVNRFLLERYSPPGVVVDEDMQIVQFRGQTGLFLEPAPGEASLNLFKMAREGLLFGLRSAVYKVRQSGGSTRKDGLQVHAGGATHIVDVEVAQLQTSSAPHYLVLFHHRQTAPPDASKARRERRSGKKGNKQSLSTDAAERLQQELSASREYLQSIIQDLEAANEELQSANEEILSSNEELQSTNEELDTAREELQSTNEELNTLNDELQGRNDDLARVNSDLINLLANVHIPIVMVSLDMRIRRFTPAAEKVLNLIPSDIGRPIGHINPDIDCPDLEERIARVSDAVVTEECEVQDRDGRWYLLRIRPYKDIENRIDGAVLSLVDVDAMKGQEVQMGMDLRFAEGILETVTQPIVVLHSDLTVRSANSAFCHEFQLPQDAVVGKRIDELGKEQWQMPALREALENVLPGNEVFENLVVEQNFADGSRRIRLNGRRLEGVDGEFILLAFEEVS